MIVNRLPQILAEQGLSIRELARRTGVTYSTIWAVVHGERRSVQLEVLEAICLVLATQPGEIYFVVSDDGQIATAPVMVASPENTKKEVERPDLIEGDTPIQAEQNQRPARPGNEWRTW